MIRFVHTFILLNHRELSDSDVTFFNYYESIIRTLCNKKIMARSVSPVVACTADRRCDRYTQKIDVRPD